MYDSDGKFLRGGVNENINVNDGSPNVNLSVLTVEDIPEIAKIAAMFKDKFGSLRSLVDEINLESNPDIQGGHTQKLCFNLRCGLVIQINDCFSKTEDKISAVYEKFGTLSDRQKLGGTLTTGIDINGEVFADYKKSGS